ncbi:TPR family protein [Sulfurospirillum diekertiae]|uniref:TPR family protein n=1 Tax=Sulfurospirillum diekertiae TaxID=1854492 RepID=A0A290HFN1_9BACT|nr:tetratricopeptide repeat protein [Sulfurospirillum diekertiae]ATB70352.1 TPR family protein [Sulfurospirillum diekertiae]
MFRSAIALLCLAVALFGATHSVCVTERSDTARAKEAIESILSTEPNNTECMLQLANIYLKQGKIAQGFEILVDAYSIDPHNVQKSRIATVLPFALKVSNLKQQAAKTNDKDIWNKLGDGYFEMGIFNEASKMYQKSLAVDDMQHMIRLKRALALQKNAQIYTAIEEVQIVLIKEPTHLYANYYMGKFLAYDLRNREEARDFFIRAKASLIAQKDTFGYLEYTNLLSDITKELGE